MHHQLRDNTARAFQRAALSPGSGEAKLQAAALFILCGEVELLCKLFVELTDNGRLVPTEDEVSLVMEIAQAADALAKELDGTPH